MCKSGICTVPTRKNMFRHYTTFSASQLAAQNVNKIFSEFQLRLMFLEGGRWLRWHHHTSRESCDHEVTSSILLHGHILDTIWFLCPQMTPLSYGLLFGEVMRS